MMEKERINLTVDGDVPALLEMLAGGRNKMGDYLSKLIRSVSQGTPQDEIERMDKESLRLMVQALTGRVIALEGEMLNVQATLASMIAGAQGAAAYER